MKKKKRTFILVVASIVLGLIGYYYLFPGSVSKILLSIERSSSGLTKNSIEVNGLRMEYLEGGSGDTLVLIHGFTGDKDNWTRLGKHLTPHFRLIALDLPGFGNSSLDPGGDYTISTQVERIKSFAETLNLRSFHLGGGSMGGYIAGIYASKYLEQIQSLLLIAPLGVISSELSHFDQQIKDEKPNIFFVRNLSDYDRLLDNLFVERPFIPVPLRKGLAEIAIENEMLYRMIFEQVYRPADVPPLEKAMKNLSAKTLIIWGTQDLILHVSGAEILANVIPESSTELMRNLGHSPMIENPDETASRYLNFIQSTK
jgi:pimeloyl-ACP methyl ester carboxylesterase